MQTNIKLIFKPSKKAERELLCNDLVNQLSKTSSMDEYCKLFKEGFKKGEMSIVISDTSKLGFTQLYDKLFDFNTNVPQRDEKLKVLLLGVDKEGVAVYNGGNAIKTNLNIFEEAFTKLGQEKVWEEIKEFYKKKYLHSYRELANRHGHHNEKPSYWAFGYKTLGDMIVKVNEKEWEEYKKTHKDCCGVSTYKPEEKKEKKKDKKKREISKKKD